MPSSSRLLRDFCGLGRRLDYPPYARGQNGQSEKIEMNERRSNACSAAWKALLSSLVAPPDRASLFIISTNVFKLLFAVAISSGFNRRSSCMRWTPFEIHA